MVIPGTQPLPLILLPNVTPKGEVDDPAARARAAIQSLSSKLAEGNEDAFATFHAAYFNRLYRFLLVVSRGDEDHAEEAMQLTFLRILRHVRPFDSEEAFWSWLKVVARSAARDVGRKRQRYAALLSRFAAWWTGSAQTVRAVRADEESLLRCALEESLAELADADRDLLERKYVDGITSRALSGLGDQSQKALESRILRLRRDLRARILERLKSL